MENPFEIILEKLKNIEELLMNQKSNENSLMKKNLDSPEILNTDQAAKFFSISKGTVYKFTSSRKIPHFKNGKLVYFKKT
jgi:excisionase family DNA binding protein